MGTDGSKQLKGPVIPPSEILVQKFTESRGPELASLYSTIANRVNNNFKSHRNKRRRTTSYDNRGSKTRFRKKQKVGVLKQNSEESSDKNAKKVPPRHIRRRTELKSNPESGFCTSGDGTKRLRTHVWHAKRFTMTNRWGFHLPLGLHGSGKGSRALLKWLKNGTVVHDASYYCAIQLEGAQDSLLSVLSTVLAPFPSSDAENVLSGRIYANSMLYHGGAPNSYAIAPVMYMWRPNQQLADAVEEKGGAHRLRQLWIWLHASALTEGYNALKVACESQGKMEEENSSVSCTSLEGQFGTLEIMGSKAVQLLQKILHPVNRQSSMVKECSLMEDHIASSEIIALTVNDPRGLTNNITEFDPIFKDLWDVGNGLLCCPVEESVLCMEKHHQRLSSFCLADKSSEVAKASTNLDASRTCPVILLKGNNLMDSVSRWSIILPLSWVKAFWVPIVSVGARALGLRERSWIACEAGIPNFPSEYPECGSYSSLMKSEAIAIENEAALRPLSVRPFSIPIPPPWNCVRLAFNINPAESKSTQICSNEVDEVGERVVSDNDVVVARSSRTLTGFLISINGDHMPIFPHCLDKNTCITKIIRNEKILDQCSNMDMFLANRSRKMCFVRVILRTYKEGVIEDGAVICAPRLSDIHCWLSGSNSKTEIQVPQSSLAAYFVKQDSGDWEYQVPEDPEAMESNRWPIGFVTTGFVRGCKNPVAKGLCDAVLLARLRHEQWSSVTLKRRKTEIYVLTRNLRSTAYRLALASIVLEHQQEDLDHF
ncbi:ribonucleases P/MRP protein subunit POP1 [Rutidosis leptorrhynchoides]|uniref:ribonucleases P/MRP protein subunit POP1 n=1 Tax=Rutidosis leptorrhynchoides TaxID=125765 RepID=UPI003A996564